MGTMGSVRVRRSRHRFGAVGFGMFGCGLAV